MDTSRFLVEPEAPVDLAGFDTHDTEPFTGDKEQGRHHPPRV